MAKAPRPGEVNTRLESLLGREGCAGLQSELIRHTVAWTSTVASRVWLAFAPHDARSEVAPLVGDRCQLFPQVEGDLGARLLAATEHVTDLSGDGPLPIVGTDAPLLGPEHVVAANGRLAAGYGACLVPALDGGYVLIALARPVAAAFAIPPAAWGSPDVLALTVAALERAGVRSATLHPVPDLDTPADAIALRRLAACPSNVRAALTPIAVS